MSYDRDAGAAHQPAVTRELHQGGIMAGTRVLLTSQLSPCGWLLKPSVLIQAHADRPCTYRGVDGVRDQ